MWRARGQQKLCSIEMNDRKKDKQPNCDQMQITKTNNPIHMKSKSYIFIETHSDLFVEDKQTEIHTD